MNVVRNWAIGSFLAIALTCAAVSAPPQAQEVVPVYSGPAYQPLFADGLNVQSQTAGLAQQYVKAEKDDEKKELRKKLTDVLGQQFNAQVQRQQKDLEDLEKQIASLRAVLKKRQDAKSTIVERRVEQLIQEAEGLGWTAPSTPHANGPYNRLFDNVYKPDTLTAPRQR